MYKKKKKKTNSVLRIKMANVIQSEYIGKNY